MSALPEGVVTFLFTDVEGSTRLAHELGDAGWAELLAAHQWLVRRAFEAHGGLEVDTQGDAFFAVFARASDAVAAAVAAQRALDGHPWPGDRPVRVRIGLHTGEALLRDGQYVGQEVHRASRICGAAHGGQIVLSRTTADLVHEGLPAGATLDDLGEHRLKDLADAQRLFQLSAPGLRAEFPRLRTLEATHNLPAERSSFVGRDREMAEIRRLLAAHRLVTLTGIGGSGKTRLAIQVGLREAGRFPDGVCFVDLAPVSHGDLVAQAVASAAGLSFGDALGGVGGSVDDRLVAALARRRCLVLLDNCEHLLDAVAGLVDRLLAAAHDVVVLATSREVLGLEGEQIVPVPSLAVPDDVAAAESADAVRLFVERARSVKPGFTLGEDSCAPVVEICRRLDGIPLAIEFAATRVAHLSPRQIAGRLENRFRLLTGGRQRIQRQQTLAAALDWSHDLLAAEERTVFRRLAVFAGGFSLDAAEAVCAGDDAPRRVDPRRARVAGREVARHGRRGRAWRGALPPAGDGAHVRRGEARRGVRGGERALAPPRLVRRLARAHVPRRADVQPGCAALRAGRDRQSPRRRGLVHQRRPPGPARAPGDAAVLLLGVWRRPSGGGPTARGGAA